MDGDKWEIFAPILFDRLGGIIRGYMSSQVTAYGLSGTHCMHLIAIDLLDSPTTTQLANFLDMDQGNVFRSVQHLSYLEMVTTDKDTVGPRNYRIYLTDLGRELEDHILKGLSKEMSQSFEGISEDEITIMRDVIVKFLRNSNPSFGSSMDPSQVYGNYVDIIDPGVDASSVPRERISKEQPIVHESNTPRQNAKDTVVIIAPSTEGGQLGYVFSIYESGKLAIRSAMFTNQNECRATVDKMMRCADSSICDVTLKKPRLAQGNAVYEISYAQSGKFVFKLITQYREVLLVSKEYSNKTFCKRDIESLRQNLPYASISDVGL